MLREPATLECIIRFWKNTFEQSIEKVMARILLAEDDTSMREYLQRALQRVGYEVEAVGCGTEAMPLLLPEGANCSMRTISGLPAALASAAASAADAILT